MCAIYTFIMSKRSLCRFVAVTCVPSFYLLLFSPPGWAQTLPLSIRVHTESGAAITGAKIQLEQDGKLAKTALTDAEGKASIGGLALGQYNILVNAETFEQAVQLVLIQD